MFGKQKSADSKNSQAGTFSVYNQQRNATAIKRTDAGPDTGPPA